MQHGQLEEIDVERADHQQPNPPGLPQGGNGAQEQARAPLARLSGSHLNVQRANAASQIFANTVSGVSPIIAIPGKLAQCILSGQAIFKPNIKPIEATAHAIQSSLALAQLVLFTLMFFKGEQCTQSDAFLCMLLETFNAFYEGTLLVGWVPSEFSQARALAHVPRAQDPGL